MGNRLVLSKASNYELAYHEEADKYIESLIETEEYDSDDETFDEAGISEMTEFEFPELQDLQGPDMVILEDTEDVKFGTTNKYEPDVDLQTTQIEIPEMLPLISPQSVKSGSPKMKFGSSGVPNSRRRVNMTEFHGQAPDSIDPSQYDLPFENIVFEGGGNKGLAHCGALKYLESIGFKDEKIKRVAGASAGAIMAALVAVGHSAKDIEKEMTTNDMRRMFLDGSCFGILRNLFLYFGMHQANAIYKWLGRKLAEKAEAKFRERNLKGKPKDITFEQVYKCFGKELCVVVTNLNRMTTEYFHPKTTPRMPVRDAVRMSTSLPGMFASRWFRLYGQTDVFVDGGVLCNYPVHCFDGWYLSMDEEDNFTEKMQGGHSLDKLYESRFSPRSNITRTLGISIYAEHDKDFLKNVLEERLGKPEPKTPDPRPCGEQTQLYQEWKKKDVYRKQSNGVRKKRDEAARAFLEEWHGFIFILHKCDRDTNDEIDRMDLNKALEGPFWKERKHLIFCVKDPNKVFDDLTTEDTGKIPYKSLLGELGDLGIHIQNRFLGCQRSKIDGFTSFVGSIQSTLLINVKRSIVKTTDVYRTVGINTGHVETNSFDLDEEDKQFVIDRGQNRCKRFLQQFIVDNNIPRKKDLPPVSEATDA